MRLSLLEAWWTHYHACGDEECSRLLARLLRESYRAKSSEVGGNIRA